MTVFPRLIHTSVPGVGAAILGLAVVAGGCLFGGGGEPAVPAPRADRSLAPLPDRDRLYYDDAAGITDSARLVIRGEDALRRVWRRATGGRSDPPAVPRMDFSRNIVLVVAAGRMTPQDRIRVDSVGVQEVPTPAGDTEEVLRAIVRTVRGCGPFQTPAYPVEIVRVPRFAGPVDFIERSTRGAECEE